MNDPEEKDAGSVEIGMDAQRYANDSIRSLYNDTMPILYQCTSDTLTMLCTNNTITIH